MVPNHYASELGVVQLLEYSSDITHTVSSILIPFALGCSIGIGSCKQYMLGNFSIKSQNKSITWSFNYKIFYNSVTIYFYIQTLLFTNCKTKYHYFIMILSPICLVFTPFLLFLLFFMKRKREKELVKITKGIEGSAHQRYCPFWVAIFETCSNRTGLLPHRAFCGGRSTRNLCSSGTLLPSAKAYKV